MILRMHTRTRRPGFLLEPLVLPTLVWPAPLPPPWHCPPYRHQAPSPMMYTYSRQSGPVRTDGPWEAKHGSWADQHRTSTGGGWVIPACQMSRQMGVRLQMSRERRQRGLCVRGIAPSRHGMKSHGDGLRSRRWRRSPRPCVLERIHPTTAHTNVRRDRMNIGVNPCWRGEQSRRRSRRKSCGWEESKASGVEEKGSKRMSGHYTKTPEGDGKQANGSGERSMVRKMALFTSGGRVLSGPDRGQS
jgi:hypothetical protein